MLFTTQGAFMLEMPCLTALTPEPAASHAVKSRSPALCIGHWRASLAHAATTTSGSWAYPLVVFPPLGPVVSIFLRVSAESCQ